MHTAHDGTALANLPRSTELDYLSIQAALKAHAPTAPVVLPEPEYDYRLDIRNDLVKIRMVGTGQIDISGVC